MLIFNATPAKKEGQACGHKNTVTYEIHHNTPDKWGNKYPCQDICCPTYQACCGEFHMSLYFCVHMLDLVWLE